ncbi:type II toxin-antitoxin system RelE/ParE family toxin [Caballeronia sp. LP006]|uniref:type II toxin-antitoxin system RelE/ParE family toxin n=1 Tax=unclassified Caballeronia TaxID=2646786 RepID=UPI002027A1E2|nr:MULTISPECIES: type II toxin-antitoxin system RelE/ParE family toxin [unclassified Caballeronia]MDR5830077.1 type II toxin-antitoxin system RelE/ParE family toxin [Caballeronia sp. LP006]
MIVEWRPRAIRRLTEIYEYIEERDPQAAEKLFELVMNAVATLPDNPYVYRRGRVPNTRELVVHPNYLVIYRVTDRITVINVLHARRRYPRDNDS